MATTWATTTVRHGTTSGWKLHQDLGERPCDACYTAKQEYDKRLRAAPKRVTDRRRRASAQNAAWRRLAQLYPHLYRAFYEQELAARDMSIPARGVT